MLNGGCIRDKSDWRVRKYRFRGFVGLENVCVARGRQIAKQLFLLKFNPRDDDDEFLYGDTELKESSLSQVPPALIAELAVPSAGETPLLGPLVSSRRILYSTRPKRNIIDILLTSSLACVRQLNRMSEFSNLPTSPPTHPSHFASHSLAFRLARQNQQTTTYSKPTILLRTQLLHRPTTLRKWAMTRTRMR